MPSCRACAPTASLAFDVRLVRAVTRAVVAMLALPLILGCSSGGAQPQGFGPIPVRVIRLVEKPIREFDEYLATLTSRRSITLYPQVTGYIQHIHTKPGEVVAEGKTLVQINPGQQGAILRSLRSSLQTRKANLVYAIQNDESSRALVQAGLLSQLDYDQRHAQRVSAEADVRAAEAQVQAQEELLRFYSISAPTNGVVGDIPVKIGDYVTPQTRITSVDQDKLIEAYVNVPVAKTDALTKGTTLALLGDDGASLCEQKPTFVSPQVNADTQTVLIKTVCPNQGALRTAQVLKARMIWSVHPGLLVPTVAVTRQAGQHFVFIAERGPQGIVARQRPIAVGPIQENEYVVTTGLAPGTELVVSNIQKIRDGAPIAVVASDGNGASSAAPHAESPRAP